MGSDLSPFLFCLFSKREWTINGTFSLINYTITLILTAAEIKINNKKSRWENIVKDLCLGLFFQFLQAVKKTVRLNFFFFLLVLLFMELDVFLFFFVNFFSKPRIRNNYQNYKKYRIKLVIYVVVFFNWSNRSILNRK